MALTDDINQEIKAAMIAKDKVKLAALRSVKSAIMVEATKEGGTGEVDDETALNIIKKIYKQRKDAEKIYLEQGRKDLAKDETVEAKILEVYLPAQMSEDEVRKVVQAVIAKVGASSPADIGKVMGPIMGQLKGKADGGIISKVVKEELNK